MQALDRNHQVPRAMLVALVIAAFAPWVGEVNNGDAPRSLCATASDEDEQRQQPYRARRQQAFYARPLRERGSAL